MKAFLVVLLVALVSCEYELEFSSFMSKYNRVYSSKAEAAKRFQIFKANMKNIDEHNAQASKTFEMGVNKFADLTYAEFSEVYLMKAQSYAPYEEQAGLVTPIDWRQSGAVTGVKDQGSCGGCYAFGATGTSEGVCKIKTGVLHSLSEQQCLDCSRAYGNLGCGGGMPERCMNYFVAVGGIQNETTYNYTAVVGTCKFNSNLSVVSINSPKVIKGENTTQEAIAHQPVAVTLYATMKFQLYKSGLFNDTSCPNNTINHALTAVGLGIEANVSYYIIKNSWGSGWGENGYIRFLANNNGMCGIGYDNSYTTGCKNK